PDSAALPPPVSTRRHPAPSVIARPATAPPAPAPPRRPAHLGVGTDRTREAPWARGYARGREGKRPVKGDERPGKIRSGDRRPERTGNVRSRKNRRHSG